MTVFHRRRALLHVLLWFAVCGARAQTPSPSAQLESIANAAQAAQEAGNHEEALADYRRGLALHPDWAQGLWALGNLDYNLDRYSEAVDALTRLCALAPDSGAALSMLGLSEFETAAYAAARAHLQKAHDLNNTDDPAISRVADYHLALLLNRDGDFDRALALLHSAFPQQPPAQAKAAMGMALLCIPLLPWEIDPAQDALLQAAGDAAVLAAEGDPQPAAAALALLVAQYPQAPSLHAAWAKALTAAGQSQQAQAALLQEAGLPHTDIAAFYRARVGSSSAAPSNAAWQQAMQDYSSHNYAAAIAALQAWVGQKPDDGVAWAVMGLSEFELKDYGNARIHLERGRQLGLGASRQAASYALYHLALLLNRSGSFEAAGTLLATIAGDESMIAEVRFALGLSLLRMPMLPEEVDAARRPLVAGAGEIAALLRASRYDDAFPLFQKLLAQYPGAPWLHYAYGTALESLSQYDEAVTQMREEAKLSPQSALPWIRIASIALRRRLPQEALAAAKTAVRLAADSSDSDSADAHYVLGRALLDSEDITQAITELERAARRAPNSPEPHYALARAYAKAGRAEKAQQERDSFARLNALAEEQRAAQGGQAYQGPRATANSSLLNSNSNAGSGDAPAPQPQR